MSSFDGTREQWENYHLSKIAEYKEAAEKGDPEAMENLAYHTQKVLYPTRERIIEMLTFAAEKGRETAYWKLADLYANWDRKEHHDKIEHYCRLAFASGKVFTAEQPQCLYGSIKDWITEHHPEWCEMKEKQNEDGIFYLHTGRYGMNVFNGIKAEEPEDEVQMEERYCLIMKWSYEYDKESTWYSEADGEECYQLAAGAAYPLPKEEKIKVEIRSVDKEGDAIKAELYVDHHTFTVVSGQEPVIAHASNSYSVAGDSVHESWCLSFSIREK